MLPLDSSFDCDLWARVFLQVNQDQGRRGLVEVSSESSDQIENLVSLSFRGGDVWLVGFF